MKMKFYQQSWFIWVMLILFFPVGLFLLWKYSTYEKKTKLIITAVCLVLIVISQAEKDDKTITQATSQTKEEIIIEDVMPQKVDDLKPYLRKYISPEFKENEAIIVIEKSTNIVGEYLVSLDIQTKEMSREKALKHARDFIFATYKATYKANLPVIYSTATIYDQDNNRILSIGIGKKIADKLPMETWFNLKMSPSEFEEWAKKNYTQNIINGKTYFDGRCFVDKR